MQRESMAVDVVIVGAGPAGLAQLVGYYKKLRPRVRKYLFVYLRKAPK